MSQNVIQNIDLWKKRLSSISRPDVKILLVETKSDVKGTQRYINLRQISAITELWKSEEPTKSIAFMPVSSKKVQNVETALKWICDSVITDLKYSTPHH